MSEFGPKIDIENATSYIQNYHAGNLNSPSYLAYKKALEAIDNNTAEEQYIKLYEKMTDPELEVNNFPVSKEKIKQFLNEHFDKDDIKMGLIDKLQFNDGIVIANLPKNNIFQINAGQYFIPKNIYADQIDKLNIYDKTKISHNIHRGISFSNWYYEGHTKNKFVKLPIIISNQDYDPQNRALIENKDLGKVGIDYLEEIPQEERREKYILGSLAHEIAHTWYSYLLKRNPDVNNEWEQLINKHGNLTSYAQIYEDKYNKKDYDENFAEAVRLITTCPNYLKKQGKEEIVEFIQNIVNIR